MGNDAKIIIGFLLVVIALMGACLYVQSHQLDVEADYNEVQIGQINGLSETITNNCKG